MKITKQTIKKLIKEELNLSEGFGGEPELVRDFVEEVKQAQELLSTGEDSIISRLKKARVAQYYDRPGSLGKNISDAAEAVEEAMRMLRLDLELLVSEFEEPESKLGRELANAMLNKDDLPAQGGHRRLRPQGRSKY